MGKGVCQACFISEVISALVEFVHAKSADSGLLKWSYIVRLELGTGIPYGDKVFLAVFCYTDQ